MKNKGLKGKVLEYVRKNGRASTQEIYAVAGINYPLIRLVREGMLLCGVEDNKIYYRIGPGKIEKCAERRLIIDSAAPSQDKIATYLQRELGVELQLTVVNPVPQVLKKIRPRLSEEERRSKYNEYMRQYYRRHRRKHINRVLCRYNSKKLMLKEPKT